MANLSPTVECLDDTVFRALADPTRRAILAHLAQGEASVSALAAPVGRTLGTISKHVSVLESARLVAREKRGRTTYCRLRPARLRAAAEWLAALEHDWAHRLDRLAAVLDVEPSLDPQP